MPSRTIEWLDAQVMLERQDSWRGGMEASKKPVVIADDGAGFRVDQCPHLVNVEIEDAQQARTRPGTAALDDDGTGFTNPVRRLVYLDTPGSDPEILALALSSTPGEATWKRWTGTTWGDVLGDAWLPESDTVAVAMGVNTLLVSDGVGPMQIYNPSALTDAWTACGETTNDPPKGATTLIWHTSRMFAAGMDFSDGSRGVLSDVVQASDFLAFGDGKWDPVKWSFRVGTGDGQPIIALRAMHSYGLAVFKRSSIYVVDVNPTALSAADWSIYPITLASGVCGPDAICALGNSLLYMDPGVGVRSVSRMEAAAGQYQIDAPLSQPMQPWINRINWDAAARIVAHSYRHLALFFVPLDGATENNACLVFNGRNNSWNGVWLGWPASAVVTSYLTGSQRLVLGMTDGSVAQWLDYASRLPADTFTDQGAAITTELRTRSLNFGDAWQLKVPQFCELRLAATNAALNLRWLADDAVARRETIGLWREGTLLLDPDDAPTLPCRLPSARALVVRKPLRGTPHCQEGALELATTAGNLEVKNWSVGALPGRMPVQ